MAESNLASRFGITGGVTRRAHTVLLYGIGGVGKTTTASTAPASVFIDVNNGTSDLNVNRINGIGTFSDLLDALKTAIPDKTKTVVIDSLTEVEQFAVAHVLSTIPMDKGAKATSIEDYGYGKGYKHLFDVWRKFLVALEDLKKRDKNVILIAHDAITKSPNAAGEDFLQHAPSFANEKQLSAFSFGAFDHVLFMAHDIHVSKGRGKGSGSRRIYTQGNATFQAKSRTLTGEIPIKAGDGTIWTNLFTSKANAKAAEAAEAANVAESESGDGVPI
jgi:hypothetical protein